MRLIDADLLYTQLQNDEELARKRVLDTESFLPYPNNLNPSYTRYLAQMDERTRLKHMVADAPTIEPERKKGKWIEEDDGWDGIFWRCSECNEPFYLVDGTPVDNEYHYCPNCGANMKE